AALAVVHAVPLAGHEHVDADAELSPLLPAFEVCVLPSLLASDPRDVARVEDEPALALGDEPGVGSLQVCLANGLGHGRIVASSGFSTRAGHCSASSKIRTATGRLQRQVTATAARRRP